MVDIDIADQEDWLKQIKLTNLSNHALTLASKLAHGIRRNNGQVVRLQDHEMAFHLATQVVAINNSELNSLFRAFLEEALRIDDSGFNVQKIKKTKPVGTYRGVKTDN